MKKILILLFSAMIPFLGFSATAYKISVQGVDLKETGDILNNKGDIMVYLETDVGQIPFSLKPTKIKDNQGFAPIKGSHELFLPMNQIRNNKANINITVLDHDELNSSDIIMKARQVVDLSDYNFLLEDDKEQTVQVSIEKVEADSPQAYLDDHIEESLKVKQLMSKIKMTSTYQLSTKKNKDAIKKGEKNYKKMFNLRKEIVKCSNGEEYKKLKKMFNDLVLDFAGESITAERFINEDFPALPGAKGLLID